MKTRDPHPARTPRREPDPPETAIIIPARNEEEALPLVLGDLPGDRAYSVIVVDNGSTDRTAAVARAHGARVLSEPRRGYGRACRKALSYLEESQPDIVVFLDADHSDHPEEIPRLLDPILRGEADFVVGSRTRGRKQRGALPLHARVGNRLATLLIRILYGYSYSDLGPLRAIRYPELRKLDMQDPTFGWTAEMQVKALQRGLRVREVPVSYRRRVGVSKVSGTISGSLGAAVKILWTIARRFFSSR